MALPLGVGIDSVLIDAGLALVALFVGFFSALWYVRHSQVAAEPAAEGEEELDSEAEEKANDIARANMAAQQIRDLAQNVAAEVGEHSTMISDVQEDLSGVDMQSPEANDAIQGVIAKILTANEKLQGRLAEAEKKIQVQAEEIKTQQSEARTDALTKLANRRAFDDAIEQNLALFKRERRPFSLILFDVDHFKNFNDTHGHQAGDAVLKSVAKTLSQVVKVSDIPCRYGGEEFALVMPSTTVENGRVAAERVRKAIESLEVEFEDKTLQVTISVGLAEVLQGDDATKIIRRSDDAVYKSKAAGRNCGHWQDGETCLPMDVASNPEKPQEQAKPVDTETRPQESADSLPDGENFTDELQRRVAESHRFGVSLSSMHISLYNYTGLEKEYGTAVGKLLLDSVAQFIRTSLRDMDLLAKLEPGEFGVMLPGSGAKEASMVAKRIQTAISNCAIPLGGKELQLEVTIGSAEVEPDDDADSMMDRAKAQSSTPAEMAEV